LEKSLKQNLKTNLIKFYKQVNKKL